MPSVASSQNRRPWKICSDSGSISRDWPRFLFPLPTVDISDGGSPGTFGGRPRLRALTPLVLMIRGSEALVSAVIGDGLSEGSLTNALGFEARTKGSETVRVSC